MSVQADDDDLPRGDALEEDPSFRAFKLALAGEPWMDDSNCKGLGPDRFQLEQGHSARKAREVCISCTVTEECLEYGLRTGSVGVWGGEVLDLKTGHKKQMLVFMDDARPQRVGAPTRRRTVTKEVPAPVVRIAASRHRP